MEGNQVINVLVRDEDQQNDRGFNLSEDVKSQPDDQPNEMDDTNSSKGFLTITTYQSFTTISTSQPPTQIITQQQPSTNIMNLITYSTQQSTNVFENQTQNSNGQSGISFYNQIQNFEIQQNLSIAVSVQDLYVTLTREGQARNSISNNQNHSLNQILQMLLQQQQIENIINDIHKEGQYDQECIQYEVKEFNSIIEQESNIQEFECENELDQNVILKN